MIPAHLRRTILFSASAFMLVLHFQNCAPVSPGARGIADDPNASSPVYAIGGAISPGALIFEQQKLAVETEAESASIFAECSSSIANAILEWKLLDPAGGPSIIDGFGECVEGQLMINVSPAQMLACNTVYKLAVATSDRSAQSISLERLCN